MQVLIHFTIAKTSYAMMVDVIYKIILSIFLLKIPVTKGRSTSLDIEINQVNSYKCITKRRGNYSM